MLQIFPRDDRSWKGSGAHIGCLGYPSQRPMGCLLLPLEALLIPTPYYGAITQHVYLYGNVRLAYVYLDSKVRVPAFQFLHWVSL